MARTITAALAAVSIIALGGCAKQGAATNEGDASASPGNAATTAGPAAIDGTWKADLSTFQVDAKPDVFELKDGKYSCATCLPPLTLDADGAFHAVTGRPYADQISVKAVDANTVARVSQKGGKETGSSTLKVSPDGKTLTVSWKDSSTPNTAPMTGQYTETRVAAGAAGAHAISGSWKMDRVSNVSADALTEVYKLDGDMLTMKSAGQSYSAKLGGPEVPVQGDIGGTTVSVEKVGDNAIRETYHREGKPISVMTSTVGADGKMAVVIEDKRQGATTRYTANKS